VASPDNTALIGGDNPILERIGQGQAGNRNYRLRLSATRVIEVRSENENQYIVERDRSLVQRVMLPNFTVREFTWQGTGDSARLTGYTETSGEYYERLPSNGNTNRWMTEWGEVIETTGDIVRPNGEYSYTESSGLTHTLLPTGVDRRRRADAGPALDFRDGRLIAASFVSPIDGSLQPAQFFYTGNSLTRVNMPGSEGVNLRREGRSNRWTLYRGNQATSEIWQSNGQINNGECAFTRTAGGVTYTLSTTGIARRAFSEGRYVEHYGSHVLRINYGPLSEVAERRFAYENGTVRRMDLTIRPFQQGQPSLLPQHMVRGQGTEDWTFWDGRANRTFRGFFTPSLDGSYRWDGVDGYYETQAINSNRVTRGRRRVEPQISDDELRRMNGEW
jgi:hypothetical protein